MNTLLDRLETEEPACSKCVNVILVNDYLWFIQYCGFFSFQLDDIHLIKILENCTPLTLFGPVILIFREETHLN